MLNGSLVIGMVNNYFSESKKNLWSFGKARNVVIEKKKDMGSEKYISHLFRSAKEQQSC